MSTQPRLTAALERASATFEPDLEHAYGRVTARADQRRRSRRRGAIILTATGVVAATVIGAVLGSSNPSTTSHAVILSQGAIAAGTHDLPNRTTSGFRVTVGSGWRDVAAAPGDVRLARPSSEGGSLGFADVDGVVERGSGRVVQVPDLVGWLKANPDLGLLGSRPRTVGRFVGTDLTFRVRSGAGNPRGGCADCVPLFSTGRTTVTAQTGDRLRVLVLNVAGRPLVAYSYSPAAAYPAWSAVADPVIDSLATSDPSQSD